VLASRATAEGERQAAGKAAEFKKQQVVNPFCMGFWDIAPSATLRNT